MSARKARAADHRIFVQSEDLINRGVELLMSKAKMDLKVAACREHKTSASCKVFAGIFVIENNDQDKINENQDKNQGKNQGKNSP